MASNVRAQRLNGLNSPLSYMGVQPVSPGNFVIQNAPPTPTDVQNFYVGDLWLDNSSYPAKPPKIENLWFLAAKIGNLATWLNFAGGAGAIEFLVGNDGVPVGPNPAHQINVVTANTNVKVLGTPGTFTETLNFNPPSGNLFIGTDPMPSSGSANVSLGNGSLGMINGGFNNTAIGYATLVLNVTGSNNTAVGSQALSSSILSDNTAVGERSLAQTTGTQNTAIGYLTSQALGAGSYNVIIGSTAGSAYISTESSNILISSPGVVGDANTVRIGLQGNGSNNINAFYAAGIYNTAVGATNQVVVVDSTGKLGAGTGTGSFADSFPTDSGTATPSSGALTINAGNSTLVAGSSVLFTGSGSTVQLNVTDVKRNTLIGQGAGIAGITGFDNTGVGDLALSELTTGGTNTGVGAQAGVAITTGASNTLLGYQAADSLTTGSNNIALGSGAGSSYGVASGSNITIGNVGASEANTIRVGTQGSGAGQQNAAYMAGIYNTSVGATNQVVIVDSTGKLGSIAYPGQRSAFQVALNADINNATGAGTAATVIFDTTVFDLHADYNTATGIWTAPYNGIYQFNYTVAMEGITAAMTQIVLQMVLTGTGPSTLGNPAGIRNGCFNVISTNNPQWRFGSSVALSLNAGDTAKVLVNITNGAGDTASINGQTVATGFATHFSGFLVSPT